MTTIAIDIDGTWTASPDLWKDFVENANFLGIKVIIVTGRSYKDVHDNEVRSRFRIPAHVAIYATDGDPKRRFMQDLDVQVDIWIDDEPSSICGCNQPELCEDEQL